MVSLSTTEGIELAHNEGKDVPLNPPGQVNTKVDDPVYELSDDADETPNAGDEVGEHKATSVHHNRPQHLPDGWLDGVKVAVSEHVIHYLGPSTDGQWPQRLDDTVVDLISNLVPNSIPEEGVWGVGLSEEDQESQQ